MAARAPNSPRPRRPPTLPKLADVNRVLARRSLAHFIRQGWPYIDPSPYIHGWHIDAMSEHLEAVTNGEIKRLIINIPPKHMKSIEVAVAWPAWTWAQREIGPLRGPQVRWLFSSYGQALSVRDSVKCRRLIDSPWYQREMAPDFVLTSDQNTKIRFENNKGGYRLATSIEGTATGEGADIIGIDDPHNVMDLASTTGAALDSVITWFDEAMSSRLHDPKTGAYVLVMQRLSDKDLTGHVLAKALGYVHLCLPAKYEVKHPYVYAADPRKKDGEPLWPKRYGTVELNALEKSMGSFAAAGQLQQRPAPREGGMFKRHWFKYARVIPTTARRCRAWDLASSEEITSTDPSFTCSGLVAKDSEGNFYIANVRWWRESPGVVEGELLGQAKRDGKRVVVAFPTDPGQAGKMQRDYYVRRLSGHVLYTVPMTGAKETRAAPWSIQAEQGNFYLIQTGDADQDAWIERFLDSVCIFPAGAHEDDVDMVSLGFEALESKKPALAAVAPGSVDQQSPYTI